MINNYWGLGIGDWGLGNNKKESKINYLADFVFYINRNKYLTYNTFKIINILLDLI